MTRYLLILSILLLSLSCKKSESKSEVDNELNELFAIMQGSYDSEIQSQVDSTYFNISLHMYPIWKD